MLSGMYVCRYSWKWTLLQTCTLPCEWTGTKGRLRGRESQWWDFGIGWVLQGGVLPCSYYKRVDCCRMCSPFSDSLPFFPTAVCSASLLSMESIKCWVCAWSCLYLLKFEFCALASEHMSFCERIPVLWVIISVSYCEWVGPLLY